MKKKKKVVRRKSVKKPTKEFKVRLWGKHEFELDNSDLDKICDLVDVLRNNDEVNSVKRKDPLIEVEKMFT